MDIKNWLGPLATSVSPAVVRRLPDPVGGRALLGMERALARFPRSYEGSRTRYGFLMSGNTHDLLQRYVHVFGLWEPQISDWVAKFLRPGATVVDVGANVGYVSLLAASMVGPKGRVFAFEPVPSIVRDLRRNIVINGFSTIEVVPKIVADSPGRGEIFRSVDFNLGMSSTVGGHGRVSEGEVETVRVSDVIDQSQWSDVQLLKIDAEGDEMKVLMGLAPILDAMEQGSAAIIEITPYDLVARGSSSDQLVTFLNDRGFQGHLIHNDYDPSSYLRPGAAELVPMREPPSFRVDAVFIKNE